MTFLHDGEKLEGLFDVRCDEQGVVDEPKQGLGDRADVRYKGYRRQQDTWVTSSDPFVNCRHSSSNLAKKNEQSNVEHTEPCGMPMTC